MAFDENQAPFLQVKIVKQIDFVDIGDLLVGHAENLDAATGCSVVIAPLGATVGVDVRGGAPGTRETDLLDPVNLVQQAHAILLTGGSAFGLDAAAGVMQFLEEKGIGFDVQVTHVPIVCGAALFDLPLGDFRIRPDKAMGYAACSKATNRERRQGSIGAGTGATVGKILGMDRAMKGGLGSFALQYEELKIGAMVAVNCLGDVVDPHTGTKLAGPLPESGDTLLDTEEIMIQSYTDKKSLFSGNTTIGVVATNAMLTKAQAKKLASMAQNGFARTLRPAHSMYDGDTIFAMGTGRVEVDLSVLGLLAARVTEQAVLAAIRNAQSLCDMKCWSDRHQL